MNEHRQRLVEMWLEARRHFDADSLPVAGAILGLCRAAYGRHVFTEHHGDGLWRVHQEHREYVLGVGRTEHEALVHALECAPC